MKKNSFNLNNSIKINNHKLMKSEQSLVKLKKKLMNVIKN